MSINPKYDRCLHCGGELVKHPPEATLHCHTCGRSWQGHDMAKAFSMEPSRLQFAMLLAYMRDIRFALLTLADLIPKETAPEEPKEETAATSEVDPGFEPPAAKPKKRGRPPKDRMRVNPPQ